MSSREHLLKIATEAAEAANKGWDPRIDSLTQHTAEAVLNALMPQITHPDQLLGVPEVSILIGEEQKGQLTYATLYCLLGGQLVVDRASPATPAGKPRDPVEVLARGPLTVVWMP